MNSAWRGRFFGVVCACLFFHSPLPAQRVTDTQLVRNWEEKGAPPEVLRKINGRWWTQDNREVTPPGQGGSFWTIDSAPGVCQFYHHRPFQLERAELLHLWMTAPEVEAALGKPNRVFGKDQHAFWSYYAANGTKLVVRFMGDDGLLGEAKYEPRGEKSRSVASIERELNGQDIFKLMADRAWKKVQENDDARREAFRNAHRPGAAFGTRTAHPSVVAVDSVPVPPAAEEQPRAPARVISSDELAAVTPGAAREDVLSRLGEPSARHSIIDDDGTHESFSYKLDDGELVVIRLLNGKVTRIR